ncbi:related to AGE2-ADP-ribosylation factor and GTPase activating protein effector [Sporisorium reilianum f. sp. reilianum]|uniref:Related to AGE2-ADP-ribosylation factor and GTPase activating protein effector n=1 Tax=Sporisorium reilianum f. sp. reilianum TaxID=72559 RepID=A0A2N8UET6_9BASI|nr:related to AGE2-ADP-ribosylation factor and GTPase activating protein effector [Sporisorium reilianum f. sp. reilianum]
MNSKAAQERQQRILLDLARQPGNDVCADCKGRAPRWASWNLGIFICVQCAGVHRKMGVHISKVKSITLDTWTREQVDSMKQMGNVKSNRKYNPDEMRNRPPTNMEESERDSELEKYIRRKYEFRRFMDGRPPPVPSKDATFLTAPPPSSGRNGALKSPVESTFFSESQTSFTDASSIARSRTAPIPSTWSEAQQRAKANAPPLPSAAASAFRVASGSQINGASATTSTSAQSSLQLPGGAVPMRTSSVLNTRNGSTAASIAKPSSSTAQSSVFDDLISLSEPSSQTTAAQQPPLQMNPWASIQAQQQAVLSAPAIQEPTGNFWAGQSVSSGASSPMAPFGVSPSNHASTLSQMRNVPQHANTAPSFGAASPQPQINPQATGMLSATNGMMHPQYQQQRSASLGTMAFSTSPLPSPGFVQGNPFNGAQASFATSLPQTANFVGMNGQFQQQQQLGQAAFQAQSTMLSPNHAFYGQQQQQPLMQMQAAGNGVGQFHSSMMPNGFGQPGQYSSAFPQQQQQQQQHTQQGSQFGTMW